MARVVVGMAVRVWTTEGARRMVPLVVSNPPTVVKGKRERCGRVE